MTTNERPVGELHTPVMLRRTLDLLAPALETPGATVVDCTLGMGGHSEALLSASPAVRLIGLDRDPAALELAGERLAPYADRTSLVHAVYDELPDVLARLGVPTVQGVLFDLGVSSLQLDEADRGFAYAQDAPLDMRMDQTKGLSAAEVLNTYAPGDLVRILRAYGEEKQARRIVAAVVREREKEGGAGMYGTRLRHPRPACRVWWEELAERGGFHGGDSLPILEGSHPVAPATDE